MNDGRDGNEKFDANGNPILTDAKPEVKPVYDPEYAKWQKQKAIASKLSTMVAADPQFNDILESEDRIIDGEGKEKVIKFKDEIMSNPKILEDADLFAAKTRVYSRNLADKLKSSGSHTQKPEVIKTRPDGGIDERPLAQKPEVNPNDPERRPITQVSDEELRGLGYSEVDIVNIRTYGGNS